MIIRKLEKKDLFDAYLVSAYCFHMRIEDTEAEREKIESETQENWGAFTDEGSLMARIINHRYTYWLDGKKVPTGGIGAVSTLPEYRDLGAVKEMFGALLPNAYQKGEILSTLFPFKHSFYRKAGYEVVAGMNEYSFPTAVLGGYRFDGNVYKWNQGESVFEYLAIYEEFAKNFNLAAVRDEESMTGHMKVDKPFMDRKFSYIFEKDGRKLAYLIFTDIRHDPAAILQVEECAWINREGFYAILGFLARFEADYGEIRLPLPKGIDLIRIIQSPLAYDVEKKTNQSFMVRVVNAKKLLELISKPAECDFTIKVNDDIIPENNAVYRVQNSSVQETAIDCPNIEVSVMALGQMAVGAVNFDEAMLRRDVTVHANTEMLKNVFVEKKILISEHF